MTLPPEDAAGRAAAGDARHHPPDRQRVHRDDEGHGAAVASSGATIFWSDTVPAGELVGKADFRNLEALLVAAACYWALTAVFTFFQRRLETRISKGYVREGVRRRGAEEDGVAAGSSTGGGRSSCSGGGRHDASRPRAGRRGSKASPMSG